MLKEKFVIFDRLDYFLLFEKPIYEIATNKQEEIEEKLKEIDVILEEKVYIAVLRNNEAGEKINNIPTNHYR